jgi:hypothetical protein
LVGGGALFIIHLQRERESIDVWSLFRRGAKSQPPSRPDLRKISVSRASHDAHLYTNDAAALGERLSADVTKTSAVELQKSQSTPNTQQQTKEPAMQNTKEQSQEDQRHQLQSELNSPPPDKAKTAEETEHRHYGPVETALRDAAVGYEWRRETGDIQTYQHKDTGGWLHIDPQGQFYDRQTQPISREAALEHAGHVPLHSQGENAQVQSVSNSNIDQGFSL